MIATYVYVCPNIRSHDCHLLFNIIVKVQRTRLEKKKLIK